MYIPFYLIDDTWCFLEINLRNHIYWIDWEDSNKRNELDIKLENIMEKNLLCISNNKYFIYKTKDKTISEFLSSYQIYTGDGDDKIPIFSKIKDFYPEFIYLI